MLGEISPLNPRYNTQISPQSLKRNILMLFFTLKEARQNNAENLKCVKHVNSSIVCQQFGICLSLVVLKH